MNAHEPTRATLELFVILDEPTDEIKLAIAEKLLNEKK